MGLPALCFIMLDHNVNNSLKLSLIFMIHD